MNPTMAEKKAPTRKKTARPARVPQPPSARQDEQQQEHDHGEDAERAELPFQVGRRALLHRLRDLAHLHRALVGGQDRLDQVGGEAEGGQGDDEDDGDQRHVPAGQRTVGHVFLQAVGGRREACAPRIGGAASGASRGPAYRTRRECKGRSQPVQTSTTFCCPDHIVGILPARRSRGV